MGAQPVHHVVDTLHAAGLSLALTPERALKVTPASRLTPELRDLIRASKAVLIDWLNHEAANDAAPDPDRWAWPHSTAMNTGEIDAFTARLARFTDKGVSLDAAESLADKLVIRDRESDDRRLCLECAHLVGPTAAWGCKNWRLAGVAIQARGAQLPGELVHRLQRCNGFNEVSP